MATIATDLKAEIAQSAVPLNGVEAGIGFDDLAPLREWIDGARVVGLGEATHGTRDFFQLKHRLFEFLVSELDFNLFVIEAPLPQSLAINHYVLTGEGDARHSLASMPHDCWNCEEVADLIEWMRAWNAEHERKLFFYGCDPTVSAPAAMYLLDFLKRQYGSAYRRHRDALLPLATDAHFSDWVLRSETEMAEARTAIDEVIGTLAELGADSPAGQYELGLARLQAATLSQHHEWWSVPGLEGPQRMAIRDRSMAENIATLLEIHGLDSKAVVWAHNGHIQLQASGYFGFTEPPLGWNLREQFGDQYLALGFAFDHGSVTAVDENNESRACTVLSVPGTLGSVLAEAAPPICAIDLRHVSPAIGAWLADAPPSRTIGGGYYAAIDDLMWIRSNPRELFDILLFVRDTSASKRRHDTSYQEECFREWPPAPDGLANLDLDQGLAYWHILPQPEAGAYGVEVVERAGGSCLEISRLESAWPWDIVSLSQTASAEPLRGRHLTLRCPVSMEPGYDGSSAQLALRVLNARASAGFIASPAEMYRRIAWQRVATCDPETRELTLSIQVADNAETIALAVLMTGDGLARFGPITIDTGAAWDAKTADLEVGDGAG